ncbi:putative metal-dependent phosphoesterase [Elusimicrobium minutum Pei191]|uniref:Putative metal-dependent phosphoesterase n=1 Tax=Elusimicrobium minutum (strain Pei191) TaxID=445932 RepID=B2KB64_ELUMP|nr:PHP domain-containing protein [Elusimicrobium minutum]ACC97823.1 putative metal-dependent phosphoesterase [Elusimicrobium minutum Pei191]
MPVIDLHTHSKFSDGTSKPSEVVVAAVKKGVKLYALTDHDTIEGVPQAKEKAQSYKMNFVTGVEISTNEDEHLHFLGYKIKEDCADFKSFLKENSEKRVFRIKKIIKQLQAAGLDITQEDVFSRAKTIVSRAHVADALKAKRIVAARQEGFRRYLVPGAVGYVPSLGVSVVEAIRKIRSAGGLAVIAHPGLVKEKWDFKKWTDAGLNGIEVFYPSHNTAMIQELLSVSREYGLFVTAGSDHHGPASGRTPKVGMEIPDMYYDKLLESFGF